jgi:hypothetical protein
MPLRPAKFAYDRKKVTSGIQAFFEGTDVTDILNKGLEFNFISGWLYCWNSIFINHPFDVSVLYPHFFIEVKGG